MLNDNDLFAIERKNKIVELVNKKGKILVNELIEIFNVSASTIRNDLNELELQGLLKRTHGGAIKESKVSRELIPDISESHMIDEKKQIALEANKLISDGDVIALSSGTTIFELVKTLTNKKNLTVIVNNLQMALWLEENTNFKIVILGGILRNKYHFITSPIDSELLNYMNIDKTFISINGIDLEKGITTPDLETAMNYKALINKSIKSYILADHSKFDEVTFAKIININEPTSIITDNKIDNDVLEKYSKNCNIIISDIK